MKTADEIKLWRKLKKVLGKEIGAKHGITEMDLNCPECKVAVHIAFINERLDFLEFIKSNK